MLEELDRYGFKEVGEWHLSEKYKRGIDFKLNCFQNERVIYAFVVGVKVDDEVKYFVNYIGVCEALTTTLKDRMKRYRGMAGKGTNKRIAQKIKECLEQRRVVKIFVLKLDLTLRYKDLDVDLERGLENSLIQKLNPEWNKLGKQESKKSKKKQEIFPDLDLE
jgi:RNA-binding protein YhbY